MECEIQRERAESLDKKIEELIEDRRVWMSDSDD